ncbi:MAG: hypothetical protein ABJG68_10705 [Crocinitomicaceae bacterium]
MRTKLILGICLLVGAPFSQAQLNLNKLKNKVEKSTKKDDKKKTESNSNQNTTNQNNGSTTTNSTTNNTQTNPPKENNGLAKTAGFYNRMYKFMDRNMDNVATRQWSSDFIAELEILDLPRLEERINADIATAGDFLMLYPKKIPTSGMGTITQATLNEYEFARIADANALPPESADGKLILQFYVEYAYFKHELYKGKSQLTMNLQKAIQKAESAHIRQRYNDAVFAQKACEQAVKLLPDDMRISDLKDDADKLLNTVIDGFGNMICGEYHRNHLKQISVFKTKPSFATETESDEIDMIIPGEPAYITGYFAMTNKDAGGIPSMLFINPENKYAKDAYPWGHGAEVIASMFNGENVKAEFRDKAYFTFNLFPELDKVNYESHIQYFPHLNILKWLMYLPSEKHSIHVRFGRDEKMAFGKLNIDLSGENKTKLKTYFEALKTKQLAAVTFPDLAGCSDAKSSIKNYSDLAKYGKVLRITLSQSGDIMKPWPNDHEVDFNTADGYAAVEKTNGKVEIMPLEFRKRPTETSWQWWSVGTFPGLYPMDEQGTKITGVKKMEHGYEILPEQVSSCGYWYTSQR